LQWDHGKDPRIGTVPIGAFEDIREDGNGLHVRARLFDHPDVERVREAIAGGAVKGMSFRFGVPEAGDTWTRQESGVDLREIRDADIHELRAGRLPRLRQTTSVNVRSFLAGLDPEERQALVRELAADLRLALDLSDLADDGEIEDLTGGSDAWSADRGEPQSGCTARKRHGATCHPSAAPRRRRPASKRNPDVTIDIMAEIRDKSVDDLGSTTMPDELRGKTPDELSQFIEVLDAHLRTIHIDEDTGELRDKNPAEQKAFDYGLKLRDLAVTRWRNTAPCRPCSTAARRPSRRRWST
jgi:HK97 family phage prohead protease